VILTRRLQKRVSTLHGPVLTHWSIILVSSLIAFSIVIIGALFYTRARDTMQGAIRARLQDIATAAALSIDGDLLDAIQGPLDMATPEFKHLVDLLQQIQNLPDIRFAYILRKTDNPSLLAFVADADALRPPRELDVNGNGALERDEMPGYPGEFYDVTDIPLLQGKAFRESTADMTPTVDQWGPLISGYAPIRRGNNGQATAVLGVDMKADEFYTVSQSIFSPLALLFVFAIALMVAGFVAVYAEERQMRMLRKIDNERSGLLRLTFHQIGEPLTIMKWSLETLRSEFYSPELRKLVEDHVYCMDEGLGRLNSIIDTLQLAEKVDLNTIEYVRASTSLRAVIDNAINEWESSLARRGQRIVVEMAEPDVVMQLDATFIGIVLRQLLMNAIDYSDDNAVILLRVRSDRRIVRLSVEDHGCGIPAKDLERLFVKYHRASNAHLKKPDGNGLGLYITKGIVEKAGGRIWVESEEGEGTTVTFTLPMG